MSDRFKTLLFALLIGEATIFTTDYASAMQGRINEALSKKSSSGEKTVEKEIMKSVDGENAVKAEESETNNSMDSEEQDWLSPNSSEVDGVFIGDEKGRNEVWERMNPEWKYDNLHSVLFWNMTIDDSFLIRFWNCLPNRMGSVSIKNCKFEDGISYSDLLWKSPRANILSVEGDKLTKDNAKEIISYCPDGAVGDLFITSPNFTQDEVNKWLYEYWYKI